MNPETGLLEPAPVTHEPLIKMPASPEPFTTGSRRSSDRSSQLGLRHARVHGTMSYADAHTSSSDVEEVLSEADLDDSVADQTYQPLKGTSDESGSGSDADVEILDDPFAPGTNFCYFEFVSEVTELVPIYMIYLYYMLYVYISFLAAVTKTKELLKIKNPPKAKPRGRAQSASPPRSASTSERLDTTGTELIRHLPPDTKRSFGK